MSITDKISFTLGIISTILGGIAIYQAKNYKKLTDKLGEKTEKDIKMITDQILKKLNYSSMSIRRINERLYSNVNKGELSLNLHKDTLFIWKTKEFNPSNIDIVSEKLKKELSKILKPSFIEGLLKSIETATEDNNALYAATLTHQYTAEEIEKIEYLNNTFINEGIQFDIFFI